MKYRRFGKTELQIPVISCGGMRFQQSWNSSDDVTPESQANVEACVKRALELGINHFETARGYGTSEAQLGQVLPQLPRGEIIVQTKVGAQKEVGDFAAIFEHSMELLRLDYVDLFAFHGVNNLECLENVMRCLDQAQQWKKEGRIRHIGFSTHARNSHILQAIECDAFDYVNLHWYYLFQDNWPSVLAARERDMGVFIISPNDKGGVLYGDTGHFGELTAPLHPMVFNGLFCLSKPEVHTLSCGVAKPSDFDIHMETVEKLDRAEALVTPIIGRLEEEMEKALGREWLDNWQVGLPEWEGTPGEINIPAILRLYNTLKAFRMVEFCKSRYNLLGNGGHWFPGNKADKLDEVDIRPALENSPFADRIPGFLAETHALLAGEERKRLQRGEE